MLNKEIEHILARSKEHGWILEPDAKQLLKLSGLAVPKFIRTESIEDTVDFARKTGYPVVAKVVSYDVVHKSDIGGVVLGINDDRTMADTFRHFSSIKGFQGMLVEESLAGLELIVGAKIDYQFGPVILLGIGGTGVEIYRDTQLRMAPLRPEDVSSMIKGLKAHQLLEGHRGGEPIDLQKLTRMLLTFSDLVMQIESHIESIDLNPVMCTADKCVVVDARIMLKR